MLIIGLGYTRMTGSPQGHVNPPGVAGAMSVYPRTDRGREFAMVSAAGGKKGFVYSSRHGAYRALRAKGFSKTAAAKIANAGNTHGKRVRMAKKAARTRKSRGR